MIKDKVLTLFISFFGGHERSIRAKRNIVASFFISGFSIVISFLMVRVTLSYLDQTKYGIWLTISSLLTWVGFFDIGLGNGLRNKLAEALAKKDYRRGKIYVSTTYAILSIIITIVAIVFFVGNHFIDWTVILNTDKNLSSELNLLAIIVFGFFFLRFVVQIISVVLTADQRPSISNSFGALGNLIALIVISILVRTTKSSLIYIGLSLSTIPIFILFLASLYYYCKDYRLIAPSFKYVEFSHAKGLVSLGAKFFFIQIASLIIYQSSNLIISNSFGPAEVTPYGIAYKYFSVINILFAIIMVPFWSAFTDAWVKKDIVWITNIIKKLQLIWVLFSIGGFLMLIISNWFFRLWIGNQIIIPFNLSLGLFLYFMTYTFGSIYCAFINGVGKIRLQMYSSFIMAIIFIALVFILIKVLNMGVISVVIGAIISNLYGLIIAPIQCRKIIHDQAVGIWNE